MSDVGGNTILVDAHVHIYECFEPGDLFEAATQNFSKAATTLGIRGKVSGVLLLTETSSDDWFRQARDRAKKNRQILDTDSDWELHLTPGSEAFLVTRKKSGRGQESQSDYMQVYIVAGRQIVTAEGLELLALATNHTFEDGLSIVSTLKAVRSCGAIPVFPWAVGKWLGNRGKILTSLLSRDSDGGLFLGDNSGRPVFWRNPSHFKLARALNMAVLPGTDPLPIAKESKRVGSFGFAVKGSLSKEQPVDDIKQLLLAKETSIQSYGQLESPWRFFVNQIRLRLA